MSGSVWNGDGCLLTPSLSVDSGGVTPGSLQYKAPSDVNRWLGLYEEGIHQMEEPIEFYNRFGNTVRQRECLWNLAFLLLDGRQLDVAEDTVYTQLISSRREMPGTRRLPISLSSW